MKRLSELACIKFIDMKTIRITLIILALVATNLSMAQKDKKLRIGTIAWEGNTVYSDDQLNEKFSIKAGDKFNEKEINEALSYHPEGTDLSSIYMDNGYLFFSVQMKKETEGNNVNLTFDLYEGDVITIDKVLIVGNDKVPTDDILNMVVSKPNELFNRQKLNASVMKLSKSGLFDAEKVLVTPIPHPENKTVDIEFRVKEI